MTRKISRLFLIAGLCAFLVWSCGSSRKPNEEQATDEESARQKELDEIESLLGVTNDQKSDSKNTKDKQSQKKPSGKKDETLGLLDAKDVAMQQEQPAAKPQNTELEKQVTDLKAQVEKKDLMINDLKAQLKKQSEQIYQLEAQKQAAPKVSSSYTPSSGDVEYGEYESRYDQALSLFHSQDYQNAIESFESLLAAQNNHSLADNSQFWIGECHYALGQYKKAIIDFEKVFTFPKSNKLDAAQFKLGLCHLRLGDKSKAQEEFKRLVDQYPKSEYLRQAQKHLQELP
jgi:tol-pal system protein YbgF